VHLTVAGYRLFGDMLANALLSQLSVRNEAETIN